MDSNDYDEKLRPATAPTSVLVSPATSVNAARCDKLEDSALTCKPVNGASSTATPRPPSSVPWQSNRALRKRLEELAVNLNCSQSNKLNGSIRGGPAASALDATTSGAATDTKSGAAKPSGVGSARNIDATTSSEAWAHQTRRLVAVLKESCADLENAIRQRFTSDILVCYPKCISSAELDHPEKFPFLRLGSEKHEEFLQHLLRLVRPGANEHEHRLPNSRLVKHARGTARVIIPVAFRTMDNQILHFGYSQCFGMPTRASKRNDRRVLEIVVDYDPPEEIIRIRRNRPFPLAPTAPAQAPPQNTASAPIISKGLSRHRRTSQDFGFAPRRNQSTFMNPNNRHRCSDSSNSRISRISVDDGIMEDDVDDEHPQCIRTGSEQLSGDSINALEDICCPDDELHCPTCSNPSAYATNHTSTHVQDRRESSNAGITAQLNNTNVEETESNITFPFCGEAARETAALSSDTCKYLEDGGSNSSGATIEAIVRIDCGFHAARGRRARMEDRTVITVDLLSAVGSLDDPAPDNDPYLTCFFAIYDGHGGTEAVDFVSKELHKLFCRTEAYRRKDYFGAFRESFSLVEAQLGSRLRRYVEMFRRLRFLKKTESGETNCSIQHATSQSLEREIHLLENPAPVPEDLITSQCGELQQPHVSPSAGDHKEGFRWIDKTHVGIFPSKQADLANIVKPVLSSEKLLDERIQRLEVLLRRYASRRCRSKTTELIASSSNANDLHGVAGSISLFLNTDSALLGTGSADGVGNSSDLTDCSCNVSVEKRNDPNISLMLKRQTPAVKTRLRTPVSSPQSTVSEPTLGPGRDRRQQVRNGRDRCTWKRGASYDSSSNGVQPRIHPMSSGLKVGNFDGDGSIDCAIQGPDSCCDGPLLTSGTTALAAYIRGNTLYVANLGDSRCILSRNGLIACLTEDHRLRSNSREADRVKGLRGTFSFDGYLCGQLGVSRAFGNVNRFTGEKLLGLSSTPDIVHIELTEEDEFLIIACDGLFDVIPAGDAAFQVRQVLRSGTPREAAKELVEMALLSHAEDNISVIVVRFDWSAVKLQHQHQRDKRSPVEAANSTEARRSLLIPYDSSSAGPVDQANKDNTPGLAGCSLTSVASAPSLPSLLPLINVRHPPVHVTPHVQQSVRTLPPVFEEVVCAAPDEQCGSSGRNIE